MTRSSNKIYNYKKVRSGRTSLQNFKLNKYLKDFLSLYNITSKVDMVMVIL